MSQAKTMTDGFVKLNAAGAIYSDGLTGQLNAAQRAGMTIDQLGNVVVNNTAVFAKMGLGVGEGSKKLTSVFDQTTKSGKDLRTGLFALGISVEDQANMAVQVMSMMAGPSGRLKASNEEVAQKTQEYAANLKLLADLTGEDMKSKQDTIRQENDNLAFQQVLDGMDADRREAIQTSMLAMSETQRKALRETMVYGTVVSKDVALAQATNRGLANTNAAFAKMAKDGSMNVDRVLKVQTENADLMHESAMNNKGLAIAGLAGGEDAAKASQDQLKTDQLVRSLQKAKTDEEKKAILQQIKDAQAGKGKPEEKILQANQDLAVAMQGLARDSIPSIADAVTTTTDGIKESINAFKEFLKGSTAASKFDNALLISAVGGLLPVVVTMALGKMAGGGWLGGFGGAGKAGASAAARAGGIAGNAAESAGSAVGKGLGSLGEGIKSLGSGLGGGISGLLRGIASGLAALANPQTLLGLGAVTLAIMGIGKAVEWAAPGIEKIGGAIKASFEGAAVFVNNMGTAIKSVAEGIGIVIRSIGAAAVDVAKALTDSIKELAGISALKLIAVAGGITAVAGSMTAFGLGGALAKLITGDGKFDGMVSGIKMFEDINANKLRDVADAMGKLKDSMPSVTDLIKIKAAGIWDRMTGGTDKSPTAGGYGNTNMPAAGGGAAGVGTGAGAGRGSVGTSPAGGSATPLDLSGQLAGGGTKSTNFVEGPLANMAGATASGDPAIMKMIRDHEGTRYEPYKDSQGLWTVGVGHLIGDGKSLPDAWNRKFSEAEVDSMFAKDFDVHADAAKKIPGYDKLNAKGQGALVDMTFNMGPAWSKGFPRFMEALKSGNIFSMVKELQDSAWFKQVGRRAMDDIALLKDGFSNIKLMADGGITNGVSIAGEAGPEAVVPLPNGRSIPVDLDMSAMIDKMDEMIRVMKDHKSTSDRILQASA
jgi:lysozyme